MRPIGVVRNNIKQPRLDGWADVRSDILIREELAEALDGIEGYSHVIVIFAFDKVPESEQRSRVRPRGDERIPEQGVLATRSLVLRVSGVSTLSPMITKLGLLGVAIVGLRFGLENHRTAGRSAGRLTLRSAS